MTKIVKISENFHSEVRLMTKGMSAFSMATLLMILQGSFGELEGHLAYASLLFVISIPFCVVGGILSYVFCQQEEVSSVSDTALDWIMTIGWVTGIIGFFQLMLNADAFLALVFTCAVVITFALFVIVGYSLKKQKAISQRRSSDSECGTDRHGENELFTSVQDHQSK